MMVTQLPAGTTAGELALNVYSLDPGRNKERIEAGSKVIRVTGVDKSVKESDLENLFSKVWPSSTGAKFD